MEAGYFSVTDLVYDELGKLVFESFPYQSSQTQYTGRDEAQPGTSRSYDALGRILTEEAPASSMEYVYEPWSMETTNAEGQVLKHMFNSRGQLIEVQEHNGNDMYRTRYNYNELGGLTKTTDALGNIRKFSYDSLGRKTKETDLATATATGVGEWTYNYDANNNRIRSIDPKNQRIFYTYDALNRQLTEDWGENGVADITYTYDTAPNGVGLLATVQMAGYASSPQYDFAGNLKTDVQNIAGAVYTTRSTYDLLGRPKSITYPNGTTVATNTYNAAGQVETVNQNGSALVRDMDYTPSGQMSRLELANGTITESTYDPQQNLRLTHKTTSAPAGLIQDLTYTYDGVGNILTLTDASATATAKTSTYTYDDLNRLLSATTAGSAARDYTQTYAYDAIGNLTYKSDVGALTYAGTGGNGKPNPHAVTKVVNQTMTYDKNGNLLYDGRHNYRWDIRNTLSRGDSKLFFYDHTGQRKKTLNTLTQESTNYVSQYTEVRGTQTTNYLYAGPVRIAQTDSTGTSYFHQDHLGGTTLTTNAAGAITQVYDYHPYGTEAINQQSGPSQTQHSFTDKELDDDLGLYYFEARWYNPMMGRFISLDPAQMDERLPQQLILDPQSLNFYTYSRNNPINITDPSGELSETANAIMSGKASGISKAIRALYISNYIYAQHLSHALQYATPITASYFAHSLTLQPRDVYINEKNQREWGNVIDQIKNTEEFHGKLSEIIQNAEANGRTSIGGRRPLSMNETTDLKMAIGSAEMYVSGNQLDDGSWNLQISIYDTYHFDESYDYKSGGTYQQINTIAATAQDAEIITAFDQTITFSEHYE